jgi:peptidoglycan/LPS O-acetylase OafA/YrhL
VDCLSFGCLAAWLQQRLAIPGKRRAGAVIGALCCGSALMLFVIVMRKTLGQLHLFDYSLHVSVLAFGTALALWAIVEGEAELRWLRCSWLQAIGQHSYEIYLTHMFVVFATVSLFAASGASVAWAPLFYVAALLCAVMLGWLVARAYSQPLAAALRRRVLVARLALRPPAAE